MVISPATLVIMNSEFLGVLQQACGTEQWVPRGDEEVYHHMMTLAQFLVAASPHQWRLEDRDASHLTCCPMCGTDYTGSIPHSHTKTCAYLALCFSAQPRRSSELQQYLRTQWGQTKTTVALEMGHHPCHVMMAYMRHFPTCHYRHAGEFVETLLTMEEEKIPTWNVSDLIKWIKRSAPFPASSLQAPACPHPYPVLPLTLPSPQSTTSSPQTSAQSFRTPVQVSRSPPSSPRTSRSSAQVPPSTTSSPQTSGASDQPAGAMAQPSTSSGNKSRSAKLQRLLLQPHARSEAPSGAAGATQSTVPAVTIPTAPPSTALSPDTTTRHKELVEEAFELSVSTRCKACYRAEANMLLIDCGHLSLCATCCRRQTRCPLCLLAFTDFVRVYRL